MNNLAYEMFDTSLGKFGEKEEELTCQSDYRRATNSHNRRGSPT